MFQRVSKKTVVLVLAILGIVAYLFITDFKIFKRFGYNNPPATSAPIPQPGELRFLTLPDNFSISVFAENLDKPRAMVFDARGRLLVSETDGGRVMILEDKDKNGSAEAKRVLLSNLNKPHGIDFHTDPKTKKTYIYIAETNKVDRYEYDLDSGNITPVINRNIATLPADGLNSIRSIAFGPNFRKQQLIGGQSDVNTQVPIKLYISVGSSCDVCIEDTWKRAVILESDPNGNFTAEFAGGLRNSMFLTFHPQTKEIWATEIGREGLGSNLPPDEINIIRVATEEHQFGARRYGWPFCYGKQVKDTKFNPGEFSRKDIPTDCNQTEAAAIELPAHVSPLGLVFIPEKWPKEWRNNLLVAYHGSSKNQSGYKIVRFNVDKNGKVASSEDFITGWQKNGKILGSPTDLKFGSDGALYISDDVSGVIYRVTP